MRAVKKKLESGFSQPLDEVDLLKLDLFQDLNLIYSFILLFF